MTVPWSSCGRNPPGRLENKITVRPTNALNMATQRSSLVNILSSPPCYRSFFRPYLLFLPLIFLPFLPFILFFFLFFSFTFFFLLFLFFCVVFFFFFFSDYPFYV